MNDVWHFSFDYAQSISICHLADQPGPFYFLSGRKIRLFGIGIEHLQCQFNFLIDEGLSVGKGSNSVCSILHHLLAVMDLAKDQRKICIHADNCGAQGKYKFVLGFFIYLVAKGEFDEIELAFMVAGHTKFYCDAVFGLSKKIKASCRVQSN